MNLVINPEIKEILKDKGISLKDGIPILLGIYFNYKADYFYMHDDVVSLIAHTFGEVYFLPKKLMLYRQHSKNVTGNIDITFKGFLKNLCDNDKNYEERKEEGH